MPEVRDAYKADSAWMAAVLAEAFFTNPLSVWAVPDPARRAEVLAALFPLVVEDCMASGYPLVTTDGASVALWFDRTQGPVKGPTPMPDGVREICGPWADRFQAIDDAFAGLEPRGAHFYLAFLGTHPQAQGGGNGRLLLDHHHGYLAGLGTATYLEASSPDNRRLYQRAGYTDMSSQRIRHTGPQFWPMWREPGVRP